ncbi:hypothetical protein [Flavobacterium litorale]|uniref:Uncharacterized protein n=1 Tax=Flavobacterium litorale TaxID=2856519 RepID=A0ABX8V4G2_9FLAO|nr:hypothetical protein [Flavobacterium litorale]QYJ67726.1 hypothetical protein K1I41_09245 [Flavobacterium litorale]
MKPLSDYLTKSLENNNNIRFHFSYDVKDVEKHFNNSQEKATKYLLEFFRKNGVSDVFPCCASTLIIVYSGDSNHLSSLVKSELGVRFRYIITHIAENQIFYNTEKDFGKELLGEWENIIQM